MTIVYMAAILGINVIVHALGRMEPTHTVTSIRALLVCVQLICLALQVRELLSARRRFKETRAEYDRVTSRIRTRRSSGASLDA